METTSNAINQVSDVIYQAKNLKKYFDVFVRRGSSGFFIEKRKLPAVDGVSLEIKAAKTLAIVGESGCGKSTLARLLLRLIEPSSGELVFKGQDLLDFSQEKMRLSREFVQMIFQDPYSSLHPRRTVSSIISEPWRIHKHLAPSNFRECVIDLLDQVGLSPEYIDAYPVRLSGGERQRISIARALAMKPEILILDEPVSALDVSIQAQIISLLMNLQEKLNISYIFISHDLPLVRLVADEVMVMYMGKIVEKGTATEVYARPIHPYTRLLLDSAPDQVQLNETSATKISEALNPLYLPEGCRFQTRCNRKTKKCEQQEPSLESRDFSTHHCACFNPL